MIILTKLYPDSSGRNLDLKKVKVSKRKLVDYSLSINEIVRNIYLNVAYECYRKVRVLTREK